MPATVQTIPGDFPFTFPQVDYSGLNVTAPFVDPIQRTGEVGAFNRPQFQQNLFQGGLNALQLLELEFQGLQAFNRRARQLQQEGIISEDQFNQLQIESANRFNRTQIPQANIFNQQQLTAANRFNQAQRIQQLEEALPGARTSILRQLERGNILAEGRLPSTLEDRAFEVASRNAAAETSLTRGFGDESTFGRRTSDILSAQQRLNLSQIGEQTLSRFLQLGGNLAFDQPIKQNPILDQPLQFQPQQARTAQDVRGAPARPASEIAVQQQEALNRLTTIQPAQAIAFDINQRQFEAELALKQEIEKLQAEAFNVQQEAQTINAGLGTQLSVDRFNEQQEAGQQAAIFNAAGNILGGAFAGGVLRGGAGEAGGGGIFSAVGNLLGIGGAAKVPASIGGVDVVGSAATAAGEAGYQLANGTIVPASQVGTQGGTFNLSSFSQMAKPLLVTAAALRTGVDVIQAAKGLADGTITEGDVRQGLSSLIGGWVPEDINNFLGKPISQNDISNATLLSNPVTAPFAVADMIFGLDLGFDSGKSKQQQQRDSLRDLGQEFNLFTVPESGEKAGSHQMELADGSQFDAGLDGGHKWKNYGTNIDGKTERHSYDIDWSDPRASDVVGLLNPFAFMVYGENAGKMMGHLWNGVTSNNRSLSEAKRNIRHQVDKVGIDYRTGLNILKEYEQKGVINNQEFLAFTNGWADLMLSQGVRNEITI